MNPLSRLKVTFAVTMISHADIELSRKTRLLHIYSTPDVIHLAASLNVVERPHVLQYI
ncbi:hypothetical protein C8R48DRAFT_42036 [Suillus tomentosus]|nr:hypothetical protein C8R48DRAFT_42036 [Suillus tomentosus]